MSLRSIRLDKGWYKEQLAEISRLSGSLVIIAQGKYKIY